MRPNRCLRTVVLLTAALCLAGCCRPASAQEQPSPPETVARDLAAEVLRKSGDGSLGEWTRDVIERALGRAGENARQTVPGSRSPGSVSGTGGAGAGSADGTAAPLPAERHAPSLAAGRPPTAEILVLTSLSVPAASWRQWAREAARIGAPLVLRGVGEGGLRATVRQIGARLGGAEAGVAIDPRLFRLFGVTRVPAVVVVPGGVPGRSPVPPCESRGCTDDPPPPHDLVSGNIGLAAALEAVAAEGAVGRNAARVHLHRMRGEDRP